MSDSDSSRQLPAVFVDEGRFLDTTPSPRSSGDGILSDFGAMTSSDFTRMVLESNDPVITLAALGDEVDERFWQVRIQVAIVSGGEAKQVLFQEMTEAADAPARAATRRSQKEAVVNGLGLELSARQQMAVGRQIDREEAVEGNFSTFVNQGASQALERYDSTITPEILNGESRYFTDFKKRRSDLDFLNDQYQSFNACLETLHAKQLPDRKRADVIASGTTFLYIVFYRLRSLEAHIAHDPRVAGARKQIDGAYQDFQRLIVPDIRGVADLSAELQSLLQMPAQAPAETLELSDRMQALLEKIRRRQLSPTDDSDEFA